MLERVLVCRSELEVVTSSGSGSSSGCLLKICTVPFGAKFLQVFPPNGKRSRRLS